MSRFLRILACFLACVLLACALTTLASASALPQKTVELTLPCTRPAAKVPAPESSATAHALLDLTSGALLAAKNAEQRLPMASTTKIMTALVVLETVPLDTVFTVPAQAVGTEGSSVYLYQGEQISVQTLLYALLLSSANDAAMALAICTAGSVESFAELMNKKATELGLTNTHFCNPHGLHDQQHYTSASDLARLSAAALQNPVFAQIVSTKRHTQAQHGTDATRLFTNHNRLLASLDGAIGVKTGFTKKSGRCLVSAVRREGLTLIAVTLNAPNDWRDHTALHEWGFSQYVSFTPKPEPTFVPVVGAEIGEVQLLPKNAPTLTLNADHGSISCRIHLPRFLFAGFEEGQALGKAVYYMDGAVLCEVELCAATGAPQSIPRLSLWQRIKKIFGK